MRRRGGGKGKRRGRNKRATKIYYVGGYRA